MFARMVLPLVGGSPSVWNTAMVFYQVVLLAGYGYAYASTRWLGVRGQSLLHCLLPFAVALSPQLAGGPRGGRAAGGARGRAPEPVAAQRGRPARTVWVARARATQTAAPPRPHAAEEQSRAAPAGLSGGDERLTWRRRLRWVLLAFVPSSLMLGVTLYMSVYVAPIPLFWVIPLALYLVTFILAFGQPR